MDVAFVGYIVTVFATVFVLDVDAEEVPDGAAPVVEGAFRYVHAPADVIAEPASVQFLEGYAVCLIDGIYHPYVFAYKALSPVVVHDYNYFLMQRYIKGTPYRGRGLFFCHVIDHEFFINYLISRLLLQIFFFIIRIICIISINLLLKNNQCNLWSFYLSSFSSN